MKKYLLSTGSCTDKIEYYIIDLIRLNFIILPDDIPGETGIGFDYLLINEKKDEIVSSIKSKLKVLINKIKNRLGDKYDITIQSIDLINGTEGRLKLIINVNEVSEELTVSVV